MNGQEYVAAMEHVDPWEQRERRHLEMMAATIAAGMVTAGLNGHQSPACSSIPTEARNLALAIQAEVRKDD